VQAGGLVAAAEQEQAQVRLRPEKTNDTAALVVRVNSYTSSGPL
jgi:CHASE1-domain containing sensor protein